MRRSSIQYFMIRQKLIRKKITACFTFQVLGWGGLWFLIFLTLGGCKTYKVAPNGFIIQGDDNFVSVNERFIVSIGSDFLNTDIWHKSSPPLKGSRPTSEQKKVLRKLGYDVENYNLVFTSNENLPFQMIGVVNTFPLSKEGKNHFVDIGKLNRKETKYAKWYEEISVIDANQVYHAIIPVSEKLFAEKYLSLIYFNTQHHNDLSSIKEIVKVNAENYRIIGQKYLPMKTVESCSDGGVGVYFDYTVPEVVLGKGQYALIKVFSDNDKTNLVYYSLLLPEQSFGSFRLCEGNYFIEYTTLDGGILWNEERYVN